MGSSNGDQNDSFPDLFEEKIDQAIARARREPNRVYHIFKNPTHDHHWDVTGMDGNGNWNLIRQTMRANQGGIESTPDRISGRIQTIFGTYTVEVQYIIIDGLLRLTDAWVVL